MFFSFLLGRGQAPRLRFFGFGFVAVTAPRCGQGRIKYDDAASWPRAALA
ncbi:hypothetical protein ACRQF6_06665 [Actinotignum sp. GS-2025f]|nr:hypothetical protein [Actinotignum sp. SLA_B059]MDY5127724.1 hypothetical protein [Actinotignum sp. SLA_B059]